MLAKSDRAEKTLMAKAEDALRSKISTKEPEALKMVGLLAAAEPAHLVEARA